MYDAVQSRLDGETLDDRLARIEETDGELGTDLEDENDQDKPDGDKKKEDSSQKKKSPRKDAAVVGASLVNALVPNPEINRAVRQL